jgi:hypothetical protein
VKGGRKTDLAGLRRAFDESRFGSAGTLNLRESLPTGDEASRRAEAWLRQKQIEKTAEVLIITGRGNNSIDGVAVVREAVIRLLHQLKRRGVVSGHQEHSPGSLIVHLAPVSALWESPSRTNGRGVAPPAAPVDPPSLEELDPDTRRMLRDLAERALEGLGVHDTASYVHGEMLRQFSALARSIGDGPNRATRLRQAVRTALDQHG